MEPGYEFEQNKILMYWGYAQQFEIKDREIEFCQEYIYLRVIFDTSGTDDKEIRTRVIQARKCILTYYMVQSFLRS